MASINISKRKTKLIKEENKRLLCIDDQENIFGKIEKNMWIHISGAKYEDINKLSQITNINKSKTMNLEA